MTLTFFDSVSAGERALVDIEEAAGKSSPAKVAYGAEVAGSEMELAILSVDGRNGMTRYVRDQFEHAVAQDAPIGAIVVCYIDDMTDLDVDLLRLKISVLVDQSAITMSDPRPLWLYSRAWRSRHPAHNREVEVLDERLSEEVSFRSRAVEGPPVALKGKNADVVVPANQPESVSLMLISQLEAVRKTEVKSEQRLGLLRGFISALGAVLSLATGLAATRVADTDSGWIPAAAIGASTLALITVAIFLFSSDRSGSWQKRRREVARPTEVHDGELIELQGSWRQVSVSFENVGSRV